MKKTSDVGVMEWFESQDEETLYISVLAVGEIKKGITKLDPSRRKEELADWLEKVVKRYDRRILPFTLSEANLWCLPQLGMRGVAAGQLIAFTLGAIFLIWYLVSGRSRLALNFTAFKFQRDMFFDILKVGAVSCLSPLQTVLTVLIFTKILASFGTETLAGYGMGSRLEFLLTPIAFAFGVASVPMVGMAMGAGLVARARKVAWIAGAAASLTVGIIGIIVAIKPALWVSLFTDDPGVTAAAYSYFAWAGPAFAFFGMGACLYFSSQGAAKVGGPVMAGTARLLLVGVGGWWLASSGASAATLFALVGVAMAVYGLGTALSIHVTRWGK